MKHIKRVKNLNKHKLKFKEEMKNAIPSKSRR